MYQNLNDNEIYVPNNYKSRDSLRLGFIRKVFGIICIQLLTTILISAYLYSLGREFMNWFVSNMI